MGMSVGGQNVITESEIAGKIVKEDDTYYTMDFSVEQQERGLDSSYALKRVKKTECVKGRQ
jgi:hypothetical protein